MKLINTYIVVLKSTHWMYDDEVAKLLETEDGYYLETYVPKIKIIKITDNYAKKLLKGE